MNIKITDSYIFFNYSSNEEKYLIEPFFIFEDKRNVFAGGKFDATKIKKVNFIKGKKQLKWIPTGFLKDFLLTVKQNNIEVNSLEDERTKLPHQHIDYKTKDLEKHFPFAYNSHQTSALIKLLKVNRGIIKIPTAGGKGDILIAFLKEARESSLIVVDKVMLSEQLAKRAKESGLKDVGILNGKKNDTENKKYIFATIGSLKKLPSFSAFNMLLIDEVHHASAKRHQELLSEVSFPVQVGFSATPDKGDDYLFATIKQHLGDVIYEVPAEEMIENEVIAKPKIYFIENEVNPMIDWPSSYKECIIKNQERNKLIVDIVEKYKEKVLILIKDVKNKQGEILKKYIAENTDKNVEFIQGATKNRTEVLDWFENGDLDVLISTNILNEGISLKEVRILINASGLKSKTENLQKIGRGTRIKDDKKIVKIFDFLDLGNKFTQRQAKQRMSIFKKEGFKDIKIIKPHEI